jgi:histidinol phosphatase-like enzyme (inositol monophosphatase family)
VDLTPFRDFLIELAERSGELIRPYFGAGAATLGIELKSDDTIVTRVDRDAEALMRGLLAKRFPGHGIIGEEYGEERADEEFVWSLDPIDGTISFASGSPLFGTQIALLHNGVPALGAINQPILRQLCLGDGDTTTLNGKQVRVREPRALSEATLLITDILRVPLHHDGAAFDALMRGVKLVRTWGDCYGYLLLATGHADIMGDPGRHHPWDVYPLVPVIRGAGGVITDWQGNDVLDLKSVLTTTSGALHHEVIRRLNPS